MTYTKTTNLNNKNSVRNIIWFNPPYSQNVKTNIGKTFLKLTKNNRLYKIFKKNTLKLSYRCMSNMFSVIKVPENPQKMKILKATFC